MNRTVRAKITADKVARIDKLLKMEMELKNACKVVELTTNTYHRWKRENANGTEGSQCQPEKP